MASKSEIIREIENVMVDGSEGDWYIGITDNTERRKGEHEKDGNDIGHWKDWNPESEEDARDIEKFFLNKGCSNCSKSNSLKGGTGGGGNANYVYIY